MCTKRCHTLMYIIGCPIFISLFVVGIVILNVNDHEYNKYSYHGEIVEEICQQLQNGEVLFTNYTLYIEYKIDHKFIIGVYKEYDTYVGNSEPCNISVVGKEVWVNPNPDDYYIIWNISFISSYYFIYAWLGPTLISIGTIFYIIMFIILMKNILKNHGYQELNEYSH